MASRRVFIDARTYISMISAFAKVSSYKPPSFFPKYAQKLMQQIVQTYSKICLKTTVVTIRIQGEILALYHTLYDDSTSTDLHLMTVHGHKLMKGIKTQISRASNMHE